MVQIYVSDIITADPDEVWSTVRNFGGLADWHPVVKTCQIEDGKSAAEVGCVRRLETEDGGMMRERLLVLSDCDRLQSYAMIESPLPIRNYVATACVRSVTAAGTTFIEWSSTFECDADVQEEMVNLISAGIYQTAFNSLKERHE